MKNQNNQCNTFLCHERVIWNRLQLLDRWLDPCGTNWLGDVACTKVFESNIANSRRCRNEYEHIVAVECHGCVFPAFALPVCLRFVRFLWCLATVFQYHLDPRNSLDKCAANGMDCCPLTPNSRVISDGNPSQVQTNDRCSDYQVVDKQYHRFLAWRACLCVNHCLDQKQSCH